MQGQRRNSYTGTIPWGPSVGNEPPFAVLGLLKIVIHCDSLRKKEEEKTSLIISL